MSTETDRLAVLHAGGLVGRLWTASDQRLVFEYADEWLAGADSFAISQSLPLRRETYTDERAGRFFANLLPEGRLRQLVTMRLGLSVENDFALLKAIGGECAGALSVVVEQEHYSGAGEREYRPLSRQALADMLVTGDALPFVTGEGKLRLSLAGAQDKLPVYFKDGEYFLPLGDSPSSHILKFPNPDFAHLPANEVLTTRLAAAAGLRVVDAELDQVGSGFVCRVARYDRRLDRDGCIVRVHQEDFCQALGLGHRAKYEQEGGPSFTDCFGLLGRVSADPLMDAEQLLSWLAFNAAVGNADGHAKNRSLVYGHGGAIRLAPAYDLVCTRAYRRLDRALAMRVGGASDPGRIRGKDWSALAGSVGVGRKFLLQLVREVAEGVLDATGPLAGEFRSRHGDSPAVQMLVPVVEKQARRLVKLLDE